MKKQEIVDKLNALNLPAGEYVVFGSVPLAIAGIREAGDIDMLVSPKLLQELAEAGWQQINKGAKDEPYTFNDFETHDNWSFRSYAPSLEQLLATVTMVEGIPFASLDEVRKWKQASGRPKDLKDIHLLDTYIQEQHG